jgi:hypothetical protein
MPRDISFVNGSRDHQVPARHGRFGFLTVAGYCFFEFFMKKSLGNLPSSVMLRLWQDWADWSNCQSKLIR